MKKYILYSYDPQTQAIFHIHNAYNSKAEALKNAAKLLTMGYLIKIEKRKN